MLALLQLIGGLCGIASLVCYILVIVQMFQRGQTGLAVACLVLLLCGIGWLIAFIVGWMNANAWGIQKIMMIWTACFVVGAVCNGIIFATVGMGMPGVPAAPRIR